MFIIQSFTTRQHYSSNYTVTASSCIRDCSFISTLLNQSTRATLCYSAGLCDSNVSVRPSVCHAPVLCQNEETLDFFSKPELWGYQMVMSNFIKKFERGSPRQTREGKIATFLSLSLNILKTVEDTAKVTTNDQ